MLRAVARAHRATGVPITTHTPTPPEPWGLEQQRIFTDEGVDLTRVVIGHCGGTVNTDYHLSLIDNGSYLGFDHFGVPGITLEERVDAVARLCARGYAERLVLSHDAMCFVDWFPRAVMDVVTDVALDLHLRGGPSGHARGASARATSRRCWWRTRAPSSKAAPPTDGPPDYRGRRAPAQRERQDPEVPTRGRGRIEECTVTVSFSTLLFEEIGRVRRVTLNRPDHHNPLTPRCVREIIQAVEIAEADADASVIIIRSTGKSFSSGYGFIAEDTDPGDFPQHGSIESDVSAMLALARGWGRVWDCAIPVIAQVQGNCLAGGTDLALHCDLIVAADDARIGFPPVRSMGVPPTNMWLYHLGPQWTKRLVLTGDTLSGSEAKEIGLVIATAPSTALDGVVLELAQRIALIGRDLLVANKRVVNMGVELMGRSQLQRFAALNDAIGHRAPEAKAFSERIAEIGLRQAIRDRDAAFDAKPPAS